MREDWWSKIRGFQRWRRERRRIASKPLKTCFIVNPRSGCAARALPHVQAVAARHGATVRVTQRSRHASELARQALSDDCELIVAVGGDGTMNEVATTLIGAD